MAKTVNRKKSAALVKYAGELATPIIEGFGQDPAVARKFYSNERYKKFKALFAWYSIDPASPDAYCRLAVKLALDHVPGMQVRPAPKKRGAPSSWKSGLDAKLLRSVEGLPKERRTIAEAIKTLRKDEQWKKYAQQSLEARYREARRTEQSHQRTYREWKEIRAGNRIGLLDAILGDGDQYFQWLREQGFKIDEN